MSAQSKGLLLLVGDASSDRAELRAIFQPTYYLLEAENAGQAAMLLEQNSNNVVAIVADIPLVSGSSVRRLAMASGRVIPILLLMPPSLTGDLEEYAFLLGVSDVVKKPYTPLSIQRRVQILVDLNASKQDLEQLVSKQNEIIRHSNQVMLDALSSIIEQRSTESGNHVLRIRRFTKILLEEVKRCCPEYQLTDTIIDIVASAAALHDIGKIAIPDVILNKPGPLTKEEFQVMQTHTTIGSQLVRQLSGLSDATFLSYAYHITLYHHERWDGSGYPQGLKGDEIPICAQVVGLADAYDALTSQRAYKGPYPCEQAVSMVVAGECGEFSPRLLMCFRNVSQEFIQLARRYADGYSPKHDPIYIPLPQPVSTVHALDSLQLTQLKYESVMQCLGDTVVELDMDAQVYHMVYNPNPDLEALFAPSTLPELLDRLVDNCLYPGLEADPQSIREQLYFELFQQNSRKHTFPCQLYSPDKGEYHHYQVTVMRIDHEPNVQRTLLAVLHRTEGTTPSLADRTEVPSTHVLHELTCAVFACQMNDSLTIVVGKRNLHHLTGYREDEIERLFSSSLMRLTMQEDRPILKAMTQESARRGCRVESQFRVKCKNGAYVWVLAKTGVGTEADGTQYHYCTLTDISTQKTTQSQMESDAARDRMILDRSGGIIFQWDLRTDKMTCTEEWQQQFGYAPISENFYSHLSASVTHFHPDDLPVLRMNIEALKSGRKQMDFDVRIADWQGKYLWVKIRAFAIYDQGGTATQIMGILLNINELKRDALSMKEQAERDSLTKLLNKASTQTFISDYLSQRAQATSGAGMILLDLDNFKSVNDSYGHLYGDALLTQVAAILKRLLRSQDIIGRIGGDEFLVLLKDVSDPAVLKIRCQLILDAFRDLFQKLIPDLDVSCSAGCVLYPDHGSSYSDLFQRADDALYEAKNQGKNQSVLYDPRQPYILRTGTPRVGTQVDSDRQPSLDDTSLARFAFNCLYESRNICNTINELLAVIGSHYDVSRVYIFENTDDGTACCNTFEWCNVGIPPEKENLQYLSYIHDIPGFRTLYNERDVFYCTDITQLAPQFRNVLEPQGIKSLLHCSMTEGNQFFGYMGFDECHSNRLWTQNQISSLKLLARIVAVFLTKQRSLDKESVEAGGSANLPPIPQAPI